MSKKVEMNAETGKVGANPKVQEAPKKYFQLNIEISEKGQLQITHDGKGLTDYEVISFLEVVKANFTKNVLNNFKQ